MVVTEPGSTYAFYRTFQAEESLAKVAGYFSVSVDDVSRHNRIAPNASPPQGQALYIRLDYSCAQTNVTSQMEVPHTIVKGDNFALLPTTIYGGLTTYEAMMVWNPMMMVYNLTIGYTIKVPIFCACPTVGQIALGINFLLTTTVYPNETLDIISGYFGIATEELSSANRVPSSDTLWDHSTLLVPLVSLPPIPTKRAPHVIISPTSSYSESRRKVGIIRGVAAGAVAALLVLWLFIARCRRTSSKKQGDKISDFSLVDRNLVPRMFTFKELSKVTVDNEDSGHGANTSARR